MVDALRQSAAALPQLVVFSEALTDMIRGADGGWIDRPGGGGWNAARVASRLGVRTAFAGAISADYFGNAISDGSLAAGLDPRFMQRVTRVPLLAMVTSIEPPTYQFIGNNSADLAFDPSLLPENWLAEAKIIQFGGGLTACLSSPHRQQTPAAALPSTLISAPQLVMRCTTSVSMQSPSDHVLSRYRMTI
jgi:sugar/nucleoside kinase (ribokinase family)